VQLLVSSGARLVPANVRVPDGGSALSCDGLYNGAHHVVESTVNATDDDGKTTGATTTTTTATATTTTSALRSWVVSHDDDDDNNNDGGDDARQGGVDVITGHRSKSKSKSKSGPSFSGLLSPGLPSPPAVLAPNFPGEVPSVQVPIDFGSGDWRTAVNQVTPREEKTKSAYFLNTGLDPHMRGDHRSLPHETKTKTPRF